MLGVGRVRRLKTASGVGCAPQAVGSPPSPTRRDASGLIVALPLLLLLLLLPPRHGHSTSVRSGGRSDMDSVMWVMCSYFLRTLKQATSAGTFTGG